MINKKIIIIIIIFIIFILFSNNVKENYENNKEVVVITCNFGNYDLNDNDIRKLNNYNLFDWVYFSDNKIEDKGYLNINDNLFPDSINILNNDKDRMKSKFYKFQSINFNFIKDYKYIIWMDASIIIENNNFVNDIVSIIKNNLDIDIFLFEHYKRNSILEEYLECKDYDKYKNQNLKKQIEFYYSKGLDDNKLFESGFLIYKNNDKIINMMNDWWKETINYGYQCQISLPYVLYTNKINFKLLNEDNFVKGNLNGSIWINKLFGRVKITHNSTKYK